VSSFGSWAPAAARITRAEPGSGVGRIV
jgi:hypothetical protein